MLRVKVVLRENLQKIEVGDLVRYKGYGKDPDLYKPDKVTNIRIYRDIMLKRNIRLYEERWNEMAMELEGGGWDFVKDYIVWRKHE